MEMPETVLDDIMAYERCVGTQAAGSLDVTALAAITELAPRPLLLTVETGSGKSTILLSNLSERHLCFTLDDTARYPAGDTRGSLTFVQRCPSFRPERTNFILGPTQRTVPKYQFDQPIDLALIDGPHGFPFPDMEYYHLYPHLRPGALLIIDDINIPTIGQLFEFLREDDMFDLIKVEAFTAFLRRTDASTFNPEGDGWWLQKFNANRIADGLERLPSYAEHSRIRELEDQITILEGQLAPRKARIAYLEDRLNDASTKLTILHRSRLLKMGRMLRRLTGRSIPY
jgi:hypothetical protein